MGVLRLYLAACVIAAHSEHVFPWSVHGGEAAVGFFFVISGFYMQLILSTDRYAGVLQFYKSRLLRIYLPYLVCLGLCMLAGLVSWGYCGNALSVQQCIELARSGNGADGVQWMVLLSNVTVFMQDAVMFLGRDSAGSACLTSGVASGPQEFYNLLVIPQAWSIAVELQFYLLSPWLVRRLSTLHLLMLIMLLTGLHTAAAIVLKLDFDPWTYRFAPFELVKFLAGIVSCRLLWQSPKGRRICEVACSWLQRAPGGLRYPMAVMGVLLAMRLHLGTGSLVNRATVMAGSAFREPLLLLVVATAAILVPLCFCLTLSLQVDRRIGELSFPVYLLHLTVVLALDGPLRGVLPGSSFLGESSLLCSVLLAMLLQKLVLDRLESNRQLTIACRRQVF
jgi:peptidoglycan/LPS O-acetylase OafA/YrhL